MLASFPIRKKGGVDEDNKNQNQNRGQSKKQQKKQKKKEDKTYGPFIPPKIHGVSEIVTGLVIKNPNTLQVPIGVPVDPIFQHIYKNENTLIEPILKKGYNLETKLFDGGFIPGKIASYYGDRGALQELKKKIVQELQTQQLSVLSKLLEKASIPDFEIELRKAINESIQETYKENFEYDHQTKADAILELSWNDVCKKTTETLIKKQSHDIIKQIEKTVNPTTSKDRLNTLQNRYQEEITEIQTQIDVDLTKQVDDLEKIITDFYKLKQTVFILSDETQLKIDKNDLLSEMQDPNPNQQTISNLQTNINKITKQINVRKELYKKAYDENIDNINSIKRKLQQTRELLQQTSDDDLKFIKNTQKQISKNYKAIIEQIKKISNSYIKIDDIEIELNKELANVAGGINATSNAPQPLTTKLQYLKQQLENLNFKLKLSSIQLKSLEDKYKQYISKNFTIKVNQDKIEELTDQINDITNLINDNKETQKNTSNKKRKNQNGGNRMVGGDKLYDELETLKTITLEFSNFYDENSYNIKNTLTEVQEQNDNNQPVENINPFQNPLPQEDDGRDINPFRNTPDNNEDEEEQDEIDIQLARGPGQFIGEREEDQQNPFGNVNPNVNNPFGNVNQNNQQGNPFGNVNQNNQQGNPFGGPVNIPNQGNPFAGGQLGGRYTGPGHITFIKRNDPNAANLTNPTWYEIFPTSFNNLTCLQFAAAYGSVDTVSILIRNKAKFDVTTRDGVSLRDLAANRPDEIRKNAVKELLEYVFNAYGIAANDFNLKKMKTDYVKELDVKEDTRSKLRRYEDVLNIVYTSTYQALSKGKDVTEVLSGEMLDVFKQAKKDGNDGNPENEKYTKSENKRIRNAYELGYKVGKAERAGTQDGLAGIESPRDTLYSDPNTPEQIKKAYKNAFNKAKGKYVYDGFKDGITGKERKPPGTEFLKFDEDLSTMLNFGDTDKKKTQQYDEGYEIGKRKFMNEIPKIISEAKADGQVDGFNKKPEYFTKYKIKTKPLLGITLQPTRSETYGDEPEIFEINYEELDYEKVYNPIPNVQIDITYDIKPDAAGNLAYGSYIQQLYKAGYKEGQNRTQGGGKTYKKKRHSKNKTYRKK